MRQVSNLFKLLSFAVIVLVGIFFIIAGIMGISQDNNWPETTGTIKSIEMTHEAVDSEDSDEYEVMVEFKIDGKKYTSDLGVYQDDFEVGKEISIRYDPESPDAIVLPGKGLSIVSIIIGAVVAVGGILALIKNLLFGR